MPVSLFDHQNFFSLRWNSAVNRQITDQILEDLHAKFKGKQSEDVILGNAIHKLINLHIK